MLASRKKFALIGAAGFIAPRHMKAIKETGNDIICALDKFDSVGVLDSFFPEADFFTEFERFDRHIEKLRLKNTPVDFVSICSPNYLHDAHIRFGLRNNADVICEKPIVLNPWNIDSLADVEKQTGKKVFNVLQLRLHPAIIELKKMIADGEPQKVYDVDLTYITSRGNWYYTSWKGDIPKSGGIATNIGVHFYDMLAWIFGTLKNNIVHVHEHDRAAGYLEFEKARVRWFLSIDYNTIPPEVRTSGKRTFRSLSIDGKAFEFSDGFSDLHTESYKNILAGEGFGLIEAKTAIEIVHEIRTQTAIGMNVDYHPFVALPFTKHPFSS
ncbi:MAG: Gfo/Idh/MocA family oxidoreductase [Chitinophagaceae bacterium]